MKETGGERGGDAVPIAIVMQRPFIHRLRR